MVICTETASSDPFGLSPRRETEGSNLSSSSGESVSLPELLSRVENPGFPRGCARQAWRPGRQRRAGCYEIAPTGGNISVAPYSSTAAPLMGVGANATPVPIKSRRSPGLMVQWISCARTDRGGSGERRILSSPWRAAVTTGPMKSGLNQSPARSADRARQAAGVSARGASLASDRAAAAHRGSPG